MEYKVLLTGLLWITASCSFSANASATESPASDTVGELMPGTTAELSSETDHYRPGIDPYCGPRCVHQILKHYGISSVDLLQCATELRWNSNRSGVDMQSVAELLNRHGINTAAFEAKPGYVLRWRHPAVAHLQSIDGNAGHFVVLLPNATREKVHIWDGPLLERVMSAQAFSERVDGGVLLTSPEPIPHSLDPFRLTAEEVEWKSGLGVTMLLLLFSITIISRSAARIVQR